jgi:hypothetical protein
MHALRVETETEICTRYEAELAEIADLDRVYYLNSPASCVDRADYYRRQDQLEQVRARLYAELSAVRRRGPFERWNLVPLFDSAQDFSSSGMVFPAAAKET